MLHERQNHNPELTAATFTGSTPSGNAIYSNSVDTLTQVLATAEYYHNRHFGGVVSFSRTTGTSDALAYGGDGSPASQYEVFELDYFPWLNFKLLLQYNAYQVVANNQNPFNLSNATFPNSPGFPNVKASDNNTWILGLWMDF